MGKSTSTVKSAKSNTQDIVNTTPVVTAPVAPVLDIILAGNWRSASTDSDAAGAVHMAQAPALAGSYFMAVCGRAYRDAGIPADPDAVNCTYCRDGEVAPKETVTVTVEKVVYRDAPAARTWQDEMPAMPRYALATDAARQAIQRVVQLLTTDSLATEEYPAVPGASPLDARAMLDIFNAYSGTLGELAKGTPGRRASRRASAASTPAAGSRAVDPARHCPGSETAPRPDSVRTSGNGWISGTCRHCGRACTYRSGGPNKGTIVNHNVPDSWKSVAGKDIAPVTPAPAATPETVETPAAA